MNNMQWAKLKRAKRMQTARQFLYPRNRIDKFLTGVRCQAAMWRGITREEDNA